MSVSLNKSTCLEIQMGIDEGFSMPAQIAYHLVEDLFQIDPKSVSCFDTSLPRFLVVTQSVACFVAIPFKMVAAVLMGIDAIFNPKDPSAWVSTGYALISVGAYAMAVPTGIIMACTPWKVAQKVHNYVTSSQGRATFGVLVLNTMQMLGFPIIRMGRQI